MFSLTDDYYRRAVENYKEKNYDLSYKFINYCLESWTHDLAHSMGISYFHGIRANAVNVGKQCHPTSALRKALVRVVEWCDAKYTSYGRAAEDGINVLNRLSECSDFGGLCYKDACVSEEDIAEFSKRFNPDSFERAKEDAKRFYISRVAKHGLFKEISAVEFSDVNNNANVHFKYDSGITKAMVKKVASENTDPFLWYLKSWIADRPLSVKGTDRIRNQKIIRLTMCTDELIATVKALPF